MCHGTWNFLSEVEVLRPFLYAWRGDNAWLHSVGGWTIGVWILLHVWSLLFPSIFHGFHNVNAGGWWEWFPTQVTPVHIPYYRHMASLPNALPQAPLSFYPHEFPDFDPHINVERVYVPYPRAVMQVGVSGDCTFDLKHASHAEFLHFGGVRYSCVPRERYCDVR